MNTRIIVLACAAALLGGLTAHAHHSFAGTYDLKKQVKLEGTLIRILWRNPHTFVHIKAADETGTPQEWSVEWSGLPQLTGSGVSANTISVGDPVVITGNPSRTAGERRLRMVTFLRTSDGFSWGNRQGEVVD